MKFRMLAVACVLLTFSTVAQQPVKKQPTLADSTVVNKLLDVCVEKFAVDASISMNLAKQARDLSRKIGYQKGEATSIKYIGNAYFFLKSPSEALTKWKEALKMFEAIGDKKGVADLQGNIGAYYYNKGDNVNALENYLQSLKIAESITYKKAIVTALNNIAGIYYLRDVTYDKALKYYLQALPLAEEMGNQNMLGTISVNMGNIFQKKNEDIKALQYYNKALKAFAESPAKIAPVYVNLGSLYLEPDTASYLPSHVISSNNQKALQNYRLGLAYARKADSQIDIMKALIGVAKVEKNLADYHSAIAHYREAEAIAKQLDALADSEDIFEGLASSYQMLGDYSNAFTYQKLFTEVKDSLYNADFDEKVATLQFDYELEKKEGQITLLEKDKQIQDADLRRQKLAKNAFMAGLALILVIVFILFRNYRQKVRVNKLLDKQKDQIENLLHNILPVEVASELKTTGSSIPKSYQKVSVLFTDFKGFTLIADKLSPEELVEELNQCFIAFDNIVEGYGLEKIKTIGDSYMCAGGIPREDPEHHLKIIRAALDIQNYIAENNNRRRAAGQETWEIRIGVHVGPLVAGVVGKKKYAYDIWGSTVNIASRMESSGVPGRVNISAATFELVKEKYACMYRGKIEAKNVGEIDMYLVDHELETNVRLIGEEGVKSKITVIPG